MLKEFKAFLLQTNALALAVGVIIGAASGKLVSALVDDIIMPLVGMLMGGGEWRAAAFKLSADKIGADGKTIAGSAIKYGDFIGTIVDFVVIAAVVFFITRMILKPAPEETPAA